MQEEIIELEKDIKSVQISRKGEALLNKMHGTKLPPLNEDIAIYLYSIGWRKIEPNKVDF